MENLLGTDLVAQVAFVVNDVDKVGAAFSAALGLPYKGYQLTDGYDVTGATYLGERMEGRAKLAFFTVGPNLKIELIEPSPEPSAWRDWLNAHGEGFHHIAFRVNGRIREVQQRLCGAGMKTIQEGRMGPRGRYAYVDAAEQLKTVLELLDSNVYPEAQA